MKESQSGSANVKVAVMWLVLVNTYGKSPKKLLNIIKLNNLTNRIDLFLVLWESKTANSLWSVEVM